MCLTYACIFKTFYCLAFRSYFHGQGTIHFSASSMPKQEPRRAKGVSAPAQSSAAASRSVATGFYQDPSRMAAVAALMGNAHVNTSLDDQLHVAIRSLAKKNETTKLKALQEITGAFSRAENSEAGMQHATSALSMPSNSSTASASGASASALDDQVLGTFAVEFTQHAQHASLAVRKAFCLALYTLISQRDEPEVKRRLSTHLPTLIGPWLVLAGDAQNEVSKLATAALEYAFPTSATGPPGPDGEPVIINKRLRVFTKMYPHALKYITDTLSHFLSVPDRCNSRLHVDATKMLVNDEFDIRTNAVRSSLKALELLLRDSPPEGQKNIISSCLGGAEVTPCDWLSAILPMPLEGQVPSVPGTSASDIHIDASRSTDFMCIFSSPSKLGPLDRSLQTALLTQLLSYVKDGQEPGDDAAEYDSADDYAQQTGTDPMTEQTNEQTDDVQKVRNKRAKYKTNVVGLGTKWESKKEKALKDAQQKKKQQLKSSLNTPDLSVSSPGVKISVMKLFSVMINVAGTFDSCSDNAFKGLHNIIGRQLLPQAANIIIYILSLARADAAGEEVDCDGDSFAVLKATLRHIYCNYANNNSESRDNRLNTDTVIVKDLFTALWSLTLQWLKKFQVEACHFLFQVDADQTDRMWSPFFNILGAILKYGVLSLPKFYAPFIEGTQDGIIHQITSNNDWLIPVYTAALVPLSQITRALRSSVSDTALRLSLENEMARIEGTVSEKLQEIFSAILCFYQNYLHSHQEVEKTPRWYTHKKNMSIVFNQLKRESSNRYYELLSVTFVDIAGQNSTRGADAKDVLLVAALPFTATAVKTQMFQIQSNSNLSNSPSIHVGDNANASYLYLELLKVWMKEELTSSSQLERLISVFEQRRAQKEIDVFCAEGFIRLLHLHWNELGKNETKVNQSTIKSLQRVILDSFQELTADAFRAPCANLIAEVFMPYSRNSQSLGEIVWLQNGPAQHADDLISLIKYLCADYGSVSFPTNESVLVENMVKLLLRQIKTLQPLHIKTADVVAALPPSLLEELLRQQNSDSDLKSIRVQDDLDIKSAGCDFFITSLEKGDVATAARLVGTLNLESRSTVSSAEEPFVVKAISALYDSVLSRFVRCEGELSRICITSTDFHSLVQFANLGGKNDSGSSAVSARSALKSERPAARTVGFSDSLCQAFSPADTGSAAGAIACGGTIQVTDDSGLVRFTDNVFSIAEILFSAMRFVTQENNLKVTSVLKALQAFLLSGCPTQTKGSFAAISFQQIVTDLLQKKAALSSDEDSDSDSDSSTDSESEDSDEQDEEDSGSDHDSIDDDENDIGRKKKDDENQIQTTAISEPNNNTVQVPVPAAFPSPMVNYKYFLSAVTLTRFMDRWVQLCHLASQSDEDGFSLLPRAFFHAVDKNLRRMILNKCSVTGMERECNDIAGDALLSHLSYLGIQMSTKQQNVEVNSQTVCYCQAEVWSAISAPFRQYIAAIIQIQGGCKSTVTQPHHHLDRFLNYNDQATLLWAFSGMQSADAFVENKQHAGTQRFSESAIAEAATNALFAGDEKNESSSLIALLCDIDFCGMMAQIVLLLSENISHDALLMQTAAKNEQNASEFIKILAFALPIYTVISYRTNDAVNSSVFALKVHIALNNIIMQLCDVLFSTFFTIQHSVSDDQNSETRDTLREKLVAVLISSLGPVGIISLWHACWQLDGSSIHFRATNDESDEEEEHEALFDGKRVALALLNLIIRQWRLGNCQSAILQHPLLVNVIIPWVGGLPPLLCRGIAADIIEQYSLVDIGSPSKASTRSPQAKGSPLDKLSTAAVSLQLLSQSAVAMHERRKPSKINEKNRRLEGNKKYSPHELDRRRKERYAGKTNLKRQEATEHSNPEIDVWDKEHDTIFLQSISALCRVPAVIKNILKMCEHYQNCHIHPAATPRPDGTDDYPLCCVGSILVLLPFFSHGASSNLAAPVTLGDVCTAAVHCLIQQHQLHHLPSNTQLNRRSTNSATVSLDKFRTTARLCTKLLYGMERCAVDGVMTLAGANHDVFNSTVSLIVLDAACECGTRLKETAVQSQMPATTAISSHCVPPEDPSRALAAALASLATPLGRLQQRQLRALRGSETSVNVIAGLLLSVHVAICAQPARSIAAIGESVLHHVVGVVCNVATVALVALPNEDVAKVVAPLATVLSAPPVRPLQERAAFLKSQSKATLNEPSSNVVDSFRAKESHLRKYLRTSVSAAAKTRLALVTFFACAFVSFSNEAAVRNFSNNRSTSSPVTASHRANATRNDWKSSDMVRLLDLITALGLSGGGKTSQQNRFCTPVMHDFSQQFEASTVFGTLAQTQHLTITITQSLTADIALCVLSMLLKRSTVRHVRQYLSANVAPPVALLATRFIETHVSPQMIQTSLAEILSHDPQPPMDGESNFISFEPEEYSGDVTLKVNLGDRRVEVVFTREEATASIAFIVPSDYPLRPAKLAAENTIRGPQGKRAKAGVSTEKWRQWLIKVSAMLFAPADGEANLWTCVKLLCDNLSHEFDGVEPCPICYSMVSVENGKLPDMSCVVCNAKFHSACMLRWWGDSGQTSCPMCRSPWFSQS